MRTREVLRHLGIARSSWYAPPPKPERARPGPKPKSVPKALAEAIQAAAQQYPWWGYKRIAVVLRRQGIQVSNKQVWRVFKAEGLFQPKRKPRAAELYQAQKLYELLPRGPNELWQADVTYLHIPGYGWWYAVTVIDYYSRYLLALHLTASFSAVEVGFAVEQARAEAERLRGPLGKAPFLVTEQWGVVFGPAVSETDSGPVCACADSLPHADSVGLVGALSSNLKTGGSLLATL